MNMNTYSPAEVAQIPQSKAYTNLAALVWTTSDLLNSSRNLSTYPPIEGLFSHHILPFYLVDLLLHFRIGAGGKSYTKYSLLSPCEYIPPENIFNL